MKNSIAIAKALKIKLSLLNTGSNTSFVERIKIELFKKKEKKFNKLSVEKLAVEYGITNKNQVKELTELAIVEYAREIIEYGVTPTRIYHALVDLYNDQVNLSMRTSRSMMLQQYSTPAPISFLASKWVESENNKAKYLEPSAGNGLMTIALPYKALHVNEVDEIRLANLESQPFHKITNFNAANFQPELVKKYDGVITNPPFDRVEKTVIDGYEFFNLDHVMAIYALKYMKDSGKAAIIVGSHTKWDNKGLVQSGKNRTFLHYLYHFYNVADIILIDGHKLYSKQGTAFDTRLILINGRKEKPSGHPGKKTPILEKVVDSFYELLYRFDLSNKLLNK